MSEESEKEVINLLKQIIRNQEIQLEKHAHSIAIQARELEFQEAAITRTEQTQDKARNIQQNAGKALIFFFLLIFILVLYLVFWLL